MTIALRRRLRGNKIQMSCTPRVRLIAQRPRRVNTALTGILMWTQKATYRPRRLHLLATCLLWTPLRRKGDQTYSPLMSFHKVTIEG